MNVIIHKGVKVYAEISPCCFMHKGYGLQVRVSLSKQAENAACEFLVDKKQQPTGPAALELVLTFLANNGLAKLTANVARWNKIDAEFRAKEKIYAAAEARRQKLLDAKMRLKGFTHRLLAWVHAGGDDQQLEVFYKGKPTPAEVKTFLRRRGCAMCNDFTLAAI